MSGCRVARRIALGARVRIGRADAGGASTLVTKVFDWSSQSFPWAGGGAGRWQTVARRGWGGGYLTGVGLWCGGGGKRRIASRGALPTTPFIVSPFVTNEWCCEVER